MKALNIIQGAAYIGPFSEWGWVSTLAVIVIGIFIFVFLYKLIFKNMKGPKVEEKKQQSERKVVPIKATTISVDGISKIRTKEEDIELDEVIVPPMSGCLLSIDEVPDPVFSQKMVGDGFAIEPSRGDIYSPVNGKVMQIYSNKDAITIQTPAAREVILHIGLNTSNLKGEGIKLNVKQGDKVKAGDKIGTIDLLDVVTKVSSLISPVVFSNLKENERVVVKQKGVVEARMEGIIVIEKDEL